MLRNPQWTSLLDLAAAGALVLAAGESPAPIYLVYLFPVVAVGLHWGTLPAYGTALAAGALDAAAHLALQGPSELAERAVPLSSLLLLALLLGQLLDVWRRRRARAVHAEQARIARDLHDEFVQLLVAAGLRVELCRSAAGGTPTMLEEELSRLHELITTCLEDMRRYLTEMRAAPLEERGLAACVRSLAADLFQHTGTRPEATFRLPPRPLPPEVETTAFYVIREALFNVRRHARASRVSVQVECRQQCLSIRVSDDGGGFAPDTVARLWERHHGLRSMRERAEVLGGAFTCCSAPGHGTRIEAEIPLRS